MPEIDADIAKFLEGTVGIVEANRFEQHCLWERYTQNDGAAWQENTMGYGVRVGDLNDMPVFLSLTTANVNGKKILFIDPTSMVVDHRLIEAWIGRVLPGVNKTDATNFHVVAPPRHP
jgi:hypothetical protein